MLLEGVVTAYPGQIGSDERPGTEFWLSTYHDQTRGPRPQSLITIHAWGPLGENALEALGPGRQVRIVGRIEEAAGDVRIVAEHIEFRGSTDAGRAVGSSAVVAGGLA